MKLDKNIINQRREKPIVQKFSLLHDACKKYPSVVLKTSSKSKLSLERFDLDFSEGGFVEKFCLTDLERNEVKRLRRIKK